MNNEETNYRVSKLEHENTSNKNALLDYRVSKLEEVVEKLGALSDVIIRWDSLLSSQGNLFELAKERNKDAATIVEHETKIVELQKEMKGLQKFMYKAAGALIIISLAMQILIPVIIDKVAQSGHSNEIKSAITENK